MEQEADKGCMHPQGLCLVKQLTDQDSTERGLLIASKTH